MRTLLALWVIGLAALLASSLPVTPELIAIVALATLLWIGSLVIDDSSIVDIFWGPAFLGLCLVAITEIYHQMVWQQWLVFAMVGLWGLRLGGHLLIRHHDKGEDERYKFWRSRYRTRWWWISLPFVFLTQAMLIWVISSPLIAVVGRASENIDQRWLAAGVTLWAVGFVYETVADWQLARFSRSEKSDARVLDSGLWRYSRHPNYFGEAVLWWGFYLCAVAFGAAWTIVAPVIVTWLLLRVSGIPMLEERLKKSRPGYISYVESTAAFFPTFKSHGSKETDRSTA